MIDEVIDWWRTGDMYYAIYLSNNIVYYSEAEIPEEYRDDEKWKKE
jgi:hypothetical protein